MQEMATSVEGIPFHLATVPVMMESAGEEIVLSPIESEGAYDQAAQVWLLPSGAARTLHEIVAKKATTCRGVCGTGPMRISEIDNINDD